MHLVPCGAKLRKFNRGGQVGSFVAPTLNTPAPTPVGFGNGDQQVLNDGVEKRLRYDEDDVLAVQCAAKRLAPLGELDSVLEGLRVDGELV